MQSAVSGLDQEFAGKVVAGNVDATTPETAAVCRELGFTNHGLVIRTGDGEVLWKQPDHEVDMADVRTAVAELLAKLSTGRMQSGGGGNGERSKKGDIRAHCA